MAQEEGCWAEPPRCTRVQLLALKEGGTGNKGSGGGMRRSSVIITANKVLITTILQINDWNT